ncbi:MAG: FAD-dependent oxidoreductase [Desulfobacterales bacterium]|nr:FAD-dependent oxidoreductase [Desulfobacterales bacterium]MBF0396676.1 FAD-dependent oxidoreductase [Desulfobacterales bacterium]
MELINLEDDSVEKKTYDLLILGGGASAMTAAIYAARKMLKIALMTKDIGGQITYTSEIENYPGFQAITGNELTDKFQAQVKAFDIPIWLDNISKVRKEEDLFYVETESETVFKGRTLIVATGKRYRSLNVPGEKEFVGRGVAYCSTCDAPFYRNRNVVVAGGGNSAVTAALDLLKVAKHVYLVNYSKGLQADPIMISSLEKFKDKLTLLDESAITKIEGDKFVTGIYIKDRKDNKERIIEAEGIFIEIGLIPNSEIVKDFVELNKNNEIVVDYKCSTNILGLFAAGDVTTVPHKQIIIAAGEGAKAALSAYEYLSKQGYV